MTSKKGMKMGEVKLVSRERRHALLDMRNKTGASLAACGAAFGISGERARQLIEWAKKEIAASG